MTWRVVFLLLVLLPAAGVPAGARADDLLDLHGEGSPFGNRLELVRHLTDRLNLRFGVASGHGAHRPHLGQPLVSESLVDEFSASALVDWSFSPWGLRLTGGALYGVDSNYRDVDPADPTLPRQRVVEEQQTVSPYFGLGLSNQFGSEGRFGLQLDLGLAFEAMPAGSGDESSQSTLNGNSGTLDGRLGSFFEGMRYTPVLSAGFRYRF